MAKNSLKILLAGDSFGAQWPDNYTGWPTLLSQSFNVTNVAQAGVGEYKILNQIKNSNLNKFDLVIVNHTSPYRIHTAASIHNTQLHANCDLIFTDIESHKNNKDPKIVTAYNWFKYHYDEQYQEDIYDLIRKEINSNIDIPYIAIDHNQTSACRAFENNRIDFSNYWPGNRGDVNHYTNDGNRYVAKEVERKILECIK